MNANQQWVVVALLKQMGYVIEIRDDEPPQARDEESKALTQALKTVKKHAR